MKKARLILWFICLNASPSWAECNWVDQAELIKIANRAYLEKHHQEFPNIKHEIRYQLAGVGGRCNDATATISFGHDPSSDPNPTKLDGVPPSVTLDPATGKVLDVSVGCC